MIVLLLVFILFFVVLVGIVKRELTPKEPTNASSARSTAPPIADPHSTAKVPMTPVKLALHSGQGSGGKGFKVALSILAVVCLLFFLSLAWSR
jgi:hypothetical protein